MIIQVRTSRDLRIGMSPAWKVSIASLRHHKVTRVHVVNFEGTLRIAGDYSEARSVENHPDHPIGRTVIGFTNGHISLCRVRFMGRNPISYHDLQYESLTTVEPSYARIGDHWPPTSREEATVLYEDMEDPVA